MSDKCCVSTTVILPDIRFFFESKLLSKPMFGCRSADDFVRIVAYVEKLARRKSRYEPKSMEKFNAFYRDFEEWYVETKSKEEKFKKDSKKAMPRLGYRITCPKRGHEAVWSRLRYK